MAGIAVPLSAPLRRILWHRPLVAGPLAMEHQYQHEPVMVDEILEVFRLTPGDIVVDGTLGLGGHSVEFIEAIAPGGTLVGFDWDEEMLSRARVRVEAHAENHGHVRTHLIHADFREAYAVLRQLSLQPKGFLMDLGLNSAQVDDRERGMSFRENGPLDMRMDRTKGEPASSLLNRISLGELEDALFELGDERWARKIAKVVIDRRKQHPLRTTQDLVDCVLAAIPPALRDKRIHPATRTFMSIRILVNRELEGLDEAIRGAAHSLCPEGTLAILSYHSGEDRIVKSAFRDLVSEGFVEIFKKPLTPSADEIRLNSRARSAKLRAIRRTVNR